MLKRIISKYIVLLIALFSVILSLSCTKELSLEENIYELLVGQKKEIKVLYGNTLLSKSELNYVSEDPEIATCTQDGFIIGVSGGYTTIYVQKIDTKEMLEIDIKVTYNVFEHKDPYVTLPNKLITNYDNLDFWSYNNYSERVGDWDIIEIGKIIINKSEDDYVFTDVYEIYSATDDVLYTVASYGNDDVELDNSIYNEIDMRKFFSGRIKVSEDAFSNYSIDKATTQVKEAISKYMDLYKGKLTFSTLSKHYQYRAYLNIDYKIYLTNNRYSRGTLNGIGSLVGDIFKGDIESFLNSYTYVEKVYEVKVTSVFLIIEKKK